MNILFDLKAIRRRMIQSGELLYTGIASWIPDILPDFMCIGAPRAATTWLHKRMRNDPRIFLPRMKELHFFDEKREIDYHDKSGLRWHRSIYFDMSKPSHWRWYSLQFLRGRDKFKGDITPDYSLLSHERVRLVHEKMPGLKVIFIMRNPIDRAWSGLRKSIWYQKGKKQVEDNSLERMLNGVMHPEVLIRGDYQRTIEIWDDIFPQEQILYLFYDDVVNDQEHELERVYSFLGLELPVGTQRVKNEKRVNAAPELDMPAEIRMELQKYYQDQIHFLEKRFNRDLSHWLKL